jgi:ABC-type transport system involved in cytochrome bd biosynthesis fused ATPase/permease subunit
VLLSLLLETVDDRPLVIDQPEDELDNRFLAETVLPALKKLKGRRQVIVATHNANIVVNGDADMVIQLEATANHGRVACSGAIEEPEVRNAIVRTVDGGDDAFRLRRLKYGF